MKIDTASLIVCFVGVVALLIVALTATGCTLFEIQCPDGSYIKERGAPLVDRTASFEVVHEWLDEETNTLHTQRISRNVKEDMNAQRLLLETMRDVFNAGARSQGLPIPD